MILDKYSMGIGDRFALQGEAQLRAFIEAEKQGIEVTPVWNKSYREHKIVGTEPASVRQEADSAAMALNWLKPYYVDADHINLDNVDLFLESSNFFTLDVADYIGMPASKEDINSFVQIHENMAGTLILPLMNEEICITKGDIERIAKIYLCAIREAGKIYRYIESVKGKDNFIIEVSMDETSSPQTPVELFFILAGIADENIPAQTIAPKFTGRFNKGVDYVGDIKLFEREFNQDLSVISLAVSEFNLPGNLKLSIHSGSDKFSIYGPINRAVKRFNCGIHLKTAGTTWLEEIIGLAQSGGEGLNIAKDVYRAAFNRFDELCAPYTAVIDIDRNQIPVPDEVDLWSSGRLVNALRHIPSHSEYSNGMRQLVHVGYKTAAEMGYRYYDALKTYESEISRNVTENILSRHLKAVFG